MAYGDFSHGLLKNTKKIWLLLSNKMYLDLDM